MKHEQVFPGQGCVKGVRRRALSWPEGGSNPHHALEYRRSSHLSVKCSQEAREVGNSDLCFSFLHQVCVYNELYRTLQMLYFQSRETKVFTFKKESVFVRIIGQREREDRKIPENNVWIHFLQSNHRMGSRSQEIQWSQRKTKSQSLSRLRKSVGPTGACIHEYIQMKCLFPGCIHDCDI